MAVIHGRPKAAYFELMLFQLVEQNFNFRIDGNALAACLSQISGHDDFYWRTPNDPKFLVFQYGRNTDLSWLGIACTNQVLQEDHFRGFSENAKSDGPSFGSFMNERLCLRSSNLCRFAVRNNLLAVTKKICFFSERILEQSSFANFSSLKKYMEDFQPRILRLDKR